MTSAVDLGPGARRGPSAATRRRVESGVGTLSTAAVARMDERLPWYRAMRAEDRSWVGLVAQAGIGAFVAWFRDPDAPLQVPPDVFGTAPRELVRSVSLGATLEMVRTVIEIVEEQVTALAAPGDEDVLREAVLRYSREVAFAAAHVYAEAAESRGAWDARLESLVVDAVLRGEADESLHSRATALGWGAIDQVAVVVGPDPAGAGAGGGRRAAPRRAPPRPASCSPPSRATGWSRSSASVTDPLADAAALAERFGAGPVVVGPIVAAPVRRGSLGPRRALRPGRGPRLGRGAATGARPTTCCPSGCSPATGRPGAPSSTGSTGRSSTRAAACSTRPRRTSSPAALWRAPPAPCSCTRTPSGTGCAGSPRSPGTTPPTPREGFVLRTALALGRLA